MHESSDPYKTEIISLLEEAYASRVNNLKLSAELANKALELSYQANDKVLIARSLTQLALFSMIMGDYKGSTIMSEQAIQYFKELNDEKGVADAKYNIAGIYYKTDNYHLGLVNLIDCLTIYRKFHDYHNQSRVLKSLGTIYEFFTDEKNAVKSYESAIKAAKKAGDLNLESNVYNPLSGIYLKQNKIKKASELIENSILMKKKTGDTRGLAFALYGRAKVFIRTKKYTEAEKDLKRSIAIHDEMGERLGLGMAIYRMAVLHLEKGNRIKAKADLEAALEWSEKYNIVIIKIKCKRLLYKIYRDENNHLKALEYLELYLEQKESVINTQTLKVIDNYALITKMETLEKEAELQKEKAEIIEKKNLAEQSAKVKQNFLSTMSHELRTPLNAVITITSLLHDRSDKEEQQLLESLRFAANNLLLIINDILDFTKLDSNKVELQPRSVNFFSLLTSIRHTYESLALEKGLSLDLKIGDGVAEAYRVDETKLSQILGNLITNAIKFTDKGRVEVKIEKISGNDSHDSLLFTIIDSGIGIPGKFLTEIFDSFSQAQSITTKKHGGTGLGLAIVKKLVELHGSTIHVNSKLRQGSEFSFMLELKRSASPVKLIKPSHQLKNKTVLLAEDNVVNAMVAVKLLTSWHVTTEIARNGVEAVERSKTKAFDFILMDLHMPEMDGVEATKNIRKGRTNPNKNTPVFALTADITAEHLEEYIPYFDGFLLKPIEIEKLYDVLSNVK